MSAREAGGAARHADEALMADLERAGVVLAADGERLRVRAPVGALTPELRDRLTQRRDEVRRIVADRYRGPRECSVAAGGGLRQPCRRMSQCVEPVDGRPCLIEPVCCLCGAQLRPSQVYLCPACAETDSPFSSEEWRA